MTLSISFKGKFTPPDINEVNVRGLYNTAELAIAQARENAPYMTGRLKSSISKEPGIITKSTRQVRIGPRSNQYAVVREFVNKRNPGKRFYMRRA